MSNVQIEAKPKENRNETANVSKISPDDIDAELKSDDPRLPSVIREQMSTFMGMVSRNSSSTDKIADKINEEHIKILLEGGLKESEQNSTYNKLKLLFMTIILVIVFAFVLIVLSLFRDSPHFETIIFSIISLAGGALGGFGIGRYAGSKDND